MNAKKYRVGKMSRKDLMNAVEYGMSLSRGDRVVLINEHRGKKYEIQVERLLHGLELSWGLPGTFFCPDGYDNR